MLYEVITSLALPTMEAIGEDAGCPCPNALAGAIITAPDKIPEGKKKELGLLIEKYV